MNNESSYGEVLKAVFPLLDGNDLVSCMLVCKQWRDIAKEDYFWKCICSRRWPSLCKRRSAPALTYHKLFLTFSKRNRCQSLLPPRLSFSDLEFYIDIWTDQNLIFSEAVPGSVLRSGIKNPPSGVSDVLKGHLDGPMDRPNYKMIMPVEPVFTVPLGRTVTISVLVGRKDTNKIACIINQSLFDYVDRNAFRALAYEYLTFSPLYPFVSGIIRAWVSLLFMAKGNDDGVIDVFGIEIDFCDAARSEEEVLWLLDMLDWK